MGKKLLDVKLIYMFFWAEARVCRAIPVPPTRSAHGRKYPLRVYKLYQHKCLVVPTYHH
jgi:hypothetical protein